MIGIVGYSRTGAGKSAMFGALTSLLGGEAVTKVQGSLQPVKALFGLEIPPHKVVKTLEELNKHLVIVKSKKDRPGAFLLDDLTPMFNASESALGNNANKWLVLSTELGKVIQHLDDLINSGTMVFITTHEALPKHLDANTSRDKNPKDYMGGPLLAGNMGSALSAICGISFRIAPGEKFPLVNSRYVLTCNDDPEWVGRDRYHKILRENPAWLPSILRASDIPIPMLHEDKIEKLTKSVDLLAVKSDEKSRRVALQIALDVAGGDIGVAKYIMCEAYTATWLNKADPLAFLL